MKCPNCGSELADDAMFCGHCGTRIENMQENAPAETAEAMTETVEAAVTEPVQPEAAAPEETPAPNSIYTAPAPSPIPASAAQTAYTVPEAEAPKPAFAPQPEAAAPEPAFTPQPKPEAPQPVPVFLPQGNPAGRLSEQDLPEEYKVVSMWKYFGLNILFALPIVGIIAMVVFSFAASKNKNITNFSRAALLAAILGTVLAVAGLVFFTVAVGGSVLYDGPRV